MFRHLLCLAAAAALLACGGNDRAPPINLDTPSDVPAAGGAPDSGPDEQPSGGKKPLSVDLREGGFINLPQVSDILYDDTREVLYVSTTQGGLATVTLEDGQISTQKIGDGPLLGLDLSPSGNKLAICENRVDEATNQYWIHILDLDDGSLKEYYFDRFYDLQEGSHGAGFADDQTLFLASSFTASGYVPLLRLNLEDGTSEELDTVVSDTMFARSLDNTTLVLAEPKDLSGPVHVIDTSTLDLVDGEVHALLHDIAINADASRVALPSQGTVKLRGRDAEGAYTVESSIDDPDRFAASAVFSPVSNSIFVTWGGTLANAPPLVARYDVETLELEATVVSSIKLALQRVGGYPPVRMKISNDGKLLFITVETGINVIPVDP
jgi:hypothetical protein